MGKDKEEKKLKKEKKEKRSETDGVTKSKKEKKDKKRRSDVSEILATELEKSPEVSMVQVDNDGDVDMGDGAVVKELKGALVPFANPLVEDTKEVKKILKTVKKCESPPWRSSEIAWRKCRPERIVASFVSHHIY
jgi:H/ACA ribonucleoprotein complex subunit 2